ncbi:hypothetical protein BDW71DRAFT_212716 [Aspergillus fruticulosus]
MPTMEYLLVLLSAASLATTKTVSGAAEDFASGVTGDGSASPIYPSDAAELESLLSRKASNVLLVGYWRRMPDEQDDCGDKPSMIRTYDAAGPMPIAVALDRALLGVGD